MAGRRTPGWQPVGVGFRVGRHYNVRPGNDPSRKAGELQKVLPWHFHCRLLIDDCRVKKSCGNSVRCPLAGTVSNRQSTIANRQSLKVDDKDDAGRPEQHDRKQDWIREKQPRRVSSLFILVHEIEISKDSEKNEWNRKVEPLPGKFYLHVM